MSVGALDAAQDAGQHCDEVWSADTTRSRSVLDGLIYSSGTMSPVGA